MRKLLHLVFAVWKTNKPFDPKHFAWDNPGDRRGSAAATAVPATSSANDKAVGHKRDEPAKKVVTTADSTVAPTAPAVKPAARPKRGPRPHVDFEFVREHVSMSHVLDRLALMATLRGRGHQRRGPCPIQSNPADPAHTFSVHLGKNVFRCFQADCAVRGNVLDLWAAIHHLPLYEAALHMAETFVLPLNREEEPVPGTRRPEAATPPPASGDEEGRRSRMPTGRIIQVLYASAECRTQRAPGLSDSRTHVRPEHRSQARAACTSIVRAASPGRPAVITADGA